MKAWQDVTDNASYTDNADAKELTTLQHAESTRVPFGSILRTHTQACFLEAGHHVEGIATNGVLLSQSELWTNMHASLTYKTPLKRVQNLQHALCDIIAALPIKRLSLSTNVTILEVSNAKERQYLTFRNWLHLKNLEGRNVCHHFASGAGEVVQCDDVRVMQGPQAGLFRLE